MHFITQAIREENRLVLVLDNGHRCVLPFVYLRHFDPSKEHANGQRTVEVSTLDVGLIPEHIRITDNRRSIIVGWADGNSEYALEWLLSHRPSESSMSLRGYRPRPTLWDKGTPGLIKIATYNELQNEDGLLSWLTYVVQFGFGLLSHVPVAPGQIREVISTFGYPMETNYGEIFNVRSDINPNNLAYTDLKISPHTDNPYRHPVPTLQVLHCLNDSFNGGDTILVDGYKVVHDLRTKYPDYFTLLCSTPVRFRFRDNDNWLEFVGPIIQCTAWGEVQTIRHNNRSMQPLEGSLDELMSFYEAYICLAKMIDDPKYALTFHMTPGDLYIVENERILHGRTAFGNTAGKRWLQGAYTDVDGLLSKWRTLSERQTNEFIDYAVV